MFTKEDVNSSLLDTSIPNIFLDLYMLNADGDYVKVYLLGYRIALTPRLGDIMSNAKLAKKLNISIDKVVEAWEYWEKSMIVKIYDRNSQSPNEFSVEFMDLKTIYLQNFCEITKDGFKAPSTYEQELNLNMFDEIEKIIGRVITPNEAKVIVDNMHNLNMPQDLIIHAFNKSMKDGKFTSVNYVSKILLNWRDKDIYTLNQALLSDESFTERKKRYQEVFKLMGFSGREASHEEKILIDSWFDYMNYDMMVVTEACRRSANVANPSIKYINGVLESWKSQGLNDIEQVLSHEEKRAKELEEKRESSKGKNNRDSNFKQTSTNRNKFINYSDRLVSGEYTDEALDEIAKRSQQRSVGEPEKSTVDYLELLRAKLNKKD